MTTENAGGNAMDTVRTDGVPPNAPTLNSGSAIRRDFAFIAQTIPNGATVLDLGCGDGALLAYLRDTKGATIQGVEVDLQLIAKCTERDVPVVQANLDDGLGQFVADAFDVVVLSQTLQVVRNPAAVLKEILRVGRSAIITFPNFGHWSGRVDLALLGRMPVSQTIPYSWDETPNIHHTTLRDFRAFVGRNGARIQRIHALRTSKSGDALEPVHVLPNLMADTIVAVIKRK